MLIGDEQVAVAVYINPGWGIDLAAGGGGRVREGEVTVASEGADRLGLIVGGVGGHQADGVAAGIGDVDLASAIYVGACRERKTRVDGEAAVARVTRCPEPATS